MKNEITVNLDNILSLDDYAKRINVSRQTVYNMIKENALPNNVIVRTIAGRQVIVINT